MFTSYSQTFIRSEINTDMDRPWEIVYGPNGMLWCTEYGGRVTRTDPNTGIKDTIYTAPDYFDGSPSESLSTCFQPIIGSGTLGMDLHPDFLTPGLSDIFYLYSYNSGTPNAPATKFKIVKLAWDYISDTILVAQDIVTDIPTSYDHLGGRLKVIKQGGTPYIYLSIGDHGISEDNSPLCYNPQSLNPNNFTQDPDSMNGKIHRFNIDGSIPSDNPIPGNSFWSRGHRNPQGLMYNPGMDLLYDAEHGDRTDDEVNVIYKGMNYGWKQVRGYHGDNNYPGEDAYIAGYTPHPAIPNDSLVPALWSWCDSAPPVSNTWLDWCTVAPSGGEYYGVGNGGIPGWWNSLLVVTLKDGDVTDRQVFRIKLTPDGRSLFPSTTQDPNPISYFSADQADNGRLRDIAVSSDGLKIYLINNGGTADDKIIEYAYTGPLAVDESDFNNLILSPNPVNEQLRISGTDPVDQIKVIDLTGRIIFQQQGTDIGLLDVSSLSEGMYILIAEDHSGRTYTKRFLKN